jgi:hypothetical protein
MLTVVTQHLAGGTEEDHTYVAVNHVMVDI